MAHQCKQCKKSYQGVWNLNKHFRNHHQPMQCTLCNVLSYGKLEHEKHQRAHGVKNGFECNLCSKLFTRKDNLKHHQRACGDGIMSPYKRPYTLLNPEITFATTKRRSLEHRIQTVDSGFNKATETYRIHFKKDMRTVDTLNILQSASFAMEDKLFMFRQKK